MRSKIKANMSQICLTEYCAQLKENFIFNFVRNPEEEKICQGDKTKESLINLKSITSIF